MHKQVEVYIRLPILESIVYSLAGHGQPMLMFFVPLEMTPPPRWKCECDLNNFLIGSA